MSRSVGDTVYVFTALMQWSALSEASSLNDRTLKSVLKGQKYRCVHLDDEKSTRKALQVFPLGMWRFS